MKQKVKHFDNKINAVPFSETISQGNYSCYDDEGFCYLLFYLMKTSRNAPQGTEMITCYAGRRVCSDRLTQLTYIPHGELTSRRCLLS
jgi:hypothetical protein